MGEATLLSGCPAGHRGAPARGRRPGLQGAVCVGVGVLVFLDAVELGMMPELEAQR